jgi:hypothetical protein
MTAVALGTSDWRRAVALAPDIQLVNRYFEKTPDPQDGPSSLIARPGLKKAISIGDGPIRGIYSQPGSFDDALFAVSGDDLYSVATDGTGTNVGTISTGGEGQVSMAATAKLETTPEYLFLCEGGVLWVYTTDGHALGHLQASGAIANNDTVTIGSTVYKWTTGSVNSGTPAGTSGSPWLVALGASNTVALQHLYDAINATGTAGTDYSTALTVHPTVNASSVSTADLYVLAKDPGTTGNSIATTETGANIAWSAVTLGSGGSAMLQQVEMPDDVGALAVAYIAGYIMVVCAQGFGVNGRFYWIEAGEITIDPLNFATAERAPDPAYSVRTVGDQFWLLGSSSVEPWYLTGDGTAPFARQQARVFDRGVWQGSDVQVKDSVVIVDSLDGTVYAVGGQGPVRISDNSIEERIRKAMAFQVQEGV